MAKVPLVRAAPLRTITLSRQNSAPRSSPMSKLLMLIAAVGKAETFEHGRDLAAWLGLVPRQSTTGGKPQLLGISKRGNKYLRKLLIHGARAALPYVAEKDTALGRWAKSLLSRVHQNVAVVAFANSWRASAGRYCEAAKSLPPRKRLWWFNHRLDGAHEALTS